jgi:hypothetical protein
MSRSLWLHEDAPGPEGERFGAQAPKRPTPPSTTSRCLRGRAGHRFWCTDSLFPLLAKGKGAKMNCSARDYEQR